MKYRVVIADDEMIIRLDVKRYLEKNGYEVVGEASDGFDAINICKKTLPDLLLMDIKMPALDGLSAAKIIMEENLASCVILATAFCDDKFIKIASKIGVMGYVVKPIDFKTLIATIEVSVAKSKQFNELKEEIKEKEKKFEERKAIERAKGLVMRNRNLSEEEAYSYIRMLSMKKKISMYKVAQTLLSTLVEF